MNASETSEKWHKENRSVGQIKIVKKLLEEATETVPYIITAGDRVIKTTARPIPILHNSGKIYLQFCGWSINLFDDGTWHWEDTTGG